MKNSIRLLIILLALLNHACTLPELPPKLKARECKEIKGVIKLQQSVSNPKSYTITLDSLAEEVKSFEWKIDNLTLKETSKSFNYSFSTTGEHNISLLITDFCAKSNEIKKRLSVCENLKAVISFKPIETEKGYYIWVDSLKGNISKVSWFVNGKKITNNKIDFGNNKSLTVTYAGTDIQELAIWSYFTDDGDYSLIAEVQDECGNILQAKKTLNIKTTYVSIPDANFEKKLINLGIDNDKKINGRIWEGDALRVKNLNVAGPSMPLTGVGKYYDEINSEDGIISSLQGIEAFKNLETLVISRNRIATVSLKNLTSLKSLDCSFNPLSTLDLQYNLGLTELRCYTTNISSLSITKNTLLQKLDCENNYIVSLDVGQNLKLTELNCGWNSIPNLNVVKNTALVKLMCYNNSLSSIDVSKNLNLSYLNCGSNNLQNLNLSANKNLTTLICYSTGLSNLDITANTLLTYLDCNNNHLSNLNLSKNTALKSLFCGGNGFSSLDISKNLALIEFQSFYNYSLFTICVQDVAKVKANQKFQKDTHTEWVKCN